MAQAEQAQAETDARVDELVSSARTWSIIACAFWAALVLWSFSAESSFGYAPFGSGLSTTVFLFIGTGVASLVGMHMVSRPIQESTGNPGHWLLFETWFWLFMLPVPVVGILMALFRAFVLFRGRLSASHIQVNNSHYSYEAVEFQRGESQPAAWLFLALGLGLPLTLLGLIGRIFS